MNQALARDDRLRQLHDQATRGVALPAHEQADLDAWYAEQDREESGRLAGTRAPRSPSTLQSQVEAAVAELRPVAEPIEELTAENNSLRQEIAGLRELLAKRSRPPGP